MDMTASSESRVCLLVAERQCLCITPGLAVVSAVTAVRWVGFGAGSDTAHDNFMTMDCLNSAARIAYALMTDFSLQGFCSQPSAW